MDRNKEERLIRRLRHSSRFLWGVIIGKQDENYDWLNRYFIAKQPPENRMVIKKASYNYVTELLLERYGIERIAKFLEQTVKEEIDKSLLDYLRSCWHDGSRPDNKILEKYTAYERYANAFLKTTTRTKSYKAFDDLITALVEIIPQPIPNTAPIEYRMSVAGWGDFAYVLFEELEEDQEYDEGLPSDEEIREHAKLLGISEESLREARRIEEQAIHDLLSEVVERMKEVLINRSIQGPMEIRLVVSDSGEVSATRRRIKEEPPR